jgi:hypothetical protein
MKKTNRIIEVQGSRGWMAPSAGLRRVDVDVNLVRGGINEHYQEVATAAVEVVAGSGGAEHDGSGVGAEQVGVMLVLRRQQLRQVQLVA